MEPVRDAPQHGAARKPPAPSTTKAVLWMVGATLSFSTMAVAGREVSAELDTFEVMLYRSVIGALSVLLLLTVLKRWSEIHTRDAGLQLFRNVGHFTGQNLWFFGVATVPLAQVFALEFTTPLWIALLAPFFLGEKWSIARIAAITVGFVGILLVAQPGRVELSPGVIAAASAALGFTVAIMTTKALSQRGHSTMNILLWMTLSQTLFGLICAGYDGDISLPTSATLPYVLAIGLGGLSAHYCITTALSLAPATVVAPMDFVRLPLIGIIGWLLYAETVNLLFVGGAVLIVLGNFLNLKAQRS
jgi:drug/metabolite transporter (DMT)-like permease